MPRSSCRWHIWRTQSQTWSCLWRTTSGWYPHVRCQSISSRKWVIRFHCRFALEYWWTSFSTVCLRSLANFAWWPNGSWNAAVPSCTGNVIQKSNYFQIFVKNSHWIEYIWEYFTLSNYISIFKIITWYFNILFKVLINSSVLTTIITNDYGIITVLSFLISW